uniref:DUF3352 domain-containing protein n=1 Tax=Cyanothece sp. (strain PCC 7425 / ATCC 29141) TaxID=395961 RepID=B8HRR2_CYAP4
MPAQKKSPWQILLLLGATGVVIGGGAIAYLFWKKPPLAAVLPVGSNLIPQSALMSLSLSTDPAQWQQLQQLGTTGAPRALADQLGKLQTQFFSDRKLDYTRDIQPWVGPQSTLAVFPLTAATITSSQDQPQVWVLPIAQPDLAQSTLNRLLSSSTAKLNQRTYKGVDVRETAAKVPHPYAIAVLNQAIVFTSAPALIDQVIDTAQGQPSLQQLSRYIPAWEEVYVPDAFARLYINLPTAVDQTSSTPSPAPTANQAPRLQGLAANLSLSSGQLHLQSLTWLKPDSPSQAPLENRPQQLAQRLPANTLAVYTGSNFQQFWQTYGQASITPLPTPLQAEQIRTNFQAATGLNFDRDLVGWMNGEFAAALVPADASGRGVGLVFLSQTGDRSGAEKAFAQLNQVMQQKRQWLVKTSTVENQPVTTWKVPPGLPVATHGWLDQNTAFLTLGTNITPTILPQPQQPLAQASLFQAATASVLKSNSGQLFIDIPRTVSVLEGTPLLPKLSPEVKKAVQGIQAIGITSARNNDWSTRYDILVQLDK